MQTSIVQPPTGVFGAEGGKLLPSKPINDDVFSVLFSQLTLGDSIIEPDGAESSDKENPDELVLGPEVKFQQLQVVRIAAVSVREPPEITKKTSAPQGALTQVQIPETIPPEEQTLITNRQIVLPDSGRLEAQENKETPERLSIIETDTGKLLAKKLPPQDTVFEWVQRPTNTKHNAQNLQKPSVMARSGFQIMQAPDASTQESHPKAQDLRQVFTNQTADKPGPATEHAGTQYSLAQIGIRRLGSDIGPVKETQVNFVKSSGAQHFPPQKHVDRNDTQPGIPPPMTVTRSQAMPSAFVTPPVPSFSTETDAVTGGITDSFMPTSETEEVVFGRTNLALNLPLTTSLESSRAGVVRFVGIQMVDAMIRQPSQPVEVALNPEELGRVRISLSHLDTGLSVAITAERPETLDLMRRHIEQLEAEFRQLGYENIGFEFTGGGANSSEQSETENQHPSDQTTDTPDPETLSPVSPQTTGVDIRL